MTLLEDGAGELFGVMGGVLEKQNDRFLVLNLTLTDTKKVELEFVRTAVLQALITLARDGGVSTLEVELGKQDQYELVAELQRMNFTEVGEGDKTLWAYDLPEKP